MNGLMKKGVAALVAGSALLAAAAPADAQRFRGGPGFNRGYHGGYGYRGYGYRGYRGGRTGVAIGAGLLGLGLGAAIASSNRPYYGGGYGGYYGGPAYYDGGYGGYYGGECYSRRVWDPYIGRSVRTETCY